MLRRAQPNGVAALSALGGLGLVLTGCGAEPNASVASVVVSSAPPSTGAESTVAATPAQTSAPPPTATNPSTTAGPTPTTSAEAATTAASGSLPDIPNRRASIAYDHPNLGPMTITIAYEDPTEDTLIDPIVRATVDATGETVFEWTDFGYYYAFGFAANSERNPSITNPVDQRGHVFFEYEPGREPGVVYLVPTATGFTSGPTPDGVQHLDARVVDSDEDGNYEIEQGFYVCTTSCADGYSYTNIWSWDGSAYTGSDADPNLSETELAQMKAAEGAFNEFLTTAGGGAYKRAWAMLTDSGQADYGGFDEFKDFWSRVDSTAIDTIRPFALADPPNPGATTGVNADVSYELVDGTSQRETVVAIMTDDDPPKIDGYTAY